MKPSMIIITNVAINPNAPKKITLKRSISISIRNMASKLQGVCFNGLSNEPLHRTQVYLPFCVVFVLLFILL